MLLKYENMVKCKYNVWTVQLKKRKEKCTKQYRCSMVELNDVSTTKLFPPYSPEGYKLRLS